MNSNNNNNNSNEVVNSFIFFNVLKDGTVKYKYPELVGNQIPPADDPTTGVKIKDVKISTDVSARIFLPNSANTNTNTNRLPLLLYIHGGGFCMESAMSERYTNYVSHLVSKANIIGVSVEYGLFPSRPIPACYDDSWEALLWIASHAKGYNGPEPWINEFADLQKVFIGGDSAGGNISHTVLTRVGSTELPKGMKVEGMIIAHPYFQIHRDDDRMWLYMCPTNEGPNDRRMKPVVEDLAKIGCSRVLVMVAEEDYLIDAGKRYVEELGKSGWKGIVELVENKGRKHCFHISNFEDSETIANIQRIVSFINRH